MDLITAQQAARALYFSWFSLLCKSHGVETEGDQVDTDRAVES